MKWLSKKNIRKWLRIIHRDLGYFMVGITMVYAISGIILNHKKHSEDPAFKTITVKEQIKQGLTISDLQNEFENTFEDYSLNKVLPNGNQYQLFVKGGVGYYNPQNGEIFFEVYRKKPVVFFLNKLHYNQKEHWTAPADIFAGSMIFFALSGLFMVRGQKGFKGRGKWFALAGIIFIVLYIWL